MEQPFNYQYGDIRPVITPAVGSSAVIQIGDLVTKTPTAAADVAWDTNLAGTQEAFHDDFLGVSCRRSLSGETAPIRVATSGVFRFKCDAATFAIGDLVGPAKATGNNLENDKVVSVATANLAIGRVVAHYGTNTTEVLVEIVSTVAHGGPQAPA